MRNPPHFRRPPRKNDAFSGNLKCQFSDFLWNHTSDLNSYNTTRFLLAFFVRFFFFFTDFCWLFFFFFFHGVNLHKSKQYNIILTLLKAPHAASFLGLAFSQTNPATWYRQRKVGLFLLKSVFVSKKICVLETKRFLLFAKIIQIQLAAAWCACGAWRWRCREAAYRSASRQALDCRYCLRSSIIDKN